MRMLIPLFLLIIGVGGGVGAGLFLMPPPVAEDLATDLASPCGPPGDVDPDHPAEIAETAPEAVPGDREYVRLNNQFVVPLVVDGQVGALMVMSITLEVLAGQQDGVFLHEPRLRDVFLQVLFDHANMGGFEGVFTSSTNMRTLRNALRRAAQDTVGPQITDVLILDIIRQDVRS